MGKIIGILLKFLGGKRNFQNFWFKLYKKALIGMNIGGGADFVSSGEKVAFEYIKTYILKEKKLVLFDVGANVGGYTQELLKYLPEAEIHCFEPAKITFRSLCQNINSTNVILNNFGISDECTEGILYYDKENSGLASLYDRQLDYFNIDFSESETIVLDTLDHYCEVNNISKIDFLKIDIEGNELKALYGAHKMLKEKKIYAIQIEFGGCNLDSRTYLRDFWNLLHEDYKVYRVVKDGLFEIQNYSEILEIFSCTNYMFISRFHV